MTTRTKAQELSHDEWYALFEPYGWPDITTRAPAVRFAVPSRFLEWEIRLMLKGPREPVDEWALRSYLLEQAHRAVSAIEDKGYCVEDAPNIEFGGRYLRTFGGDQSWTGEAQLRFIVHQERQR